MTDASTAAPPKPSAALRRSGEAADTEFAVHPAGGSTLPCELPGKTWVDFKIIDDDGKPVPHRRIKVDLPDGRSIEGVTDGDGCFGFDAIDPGDCQLTLLDLPEESCKLID